MSIDVAKVIAPTKLTGFSTKLLSTMVYCQRSLGIQSTAGFNSNYRIFLHAFRIRLDESGGRRGVQKLKTDDAEVIGPFRQIPLLAKKGISVRGCDVEFFTSFRRRTDEPYLLIEQGMLCRQPDTNLSDPRCCGVFVGAVFPLILDASGADDGAVPCLGETFMMLVKAVLTLVFSLETFKGPIGGDLGGKNCSH